MNRKHQRVAITNITITLNVFEDIRMICGQEVGIFRSTIEFRDESMCKFHKWNESFVRVCKIVFIQYVLSPNVKICKTFIWHESQITTDNVDIIIRYTTTDN